MRKIHEQGVNLNDIFMINHHPSNISFSCKDDFIGLRKGILIFNVTSSPRKFWDKPRTQKQKKESGTCKP